MSDKCKDTDEPQQDTPPASAALSDTIQSISSGENGSLPTSQPAECADPITRLALEAMREAEENPDVLTHNLLLALSTSSALRGVSNKEMELRRRLELAENVCRLICASGLHKQHMDNLLDAMNAWIKERDE